MRLRRLAGGGGAAPSGSRPNSRDHVAHGVHLIVVQGQDGELVVGDSHHYAATPDPFASEAVDRLILDEFTAVFGCPPPAVTERGREPTPMALTCSYRDSPPRVRLVMVTTGAGASRRSPGEEVINDLMEGKRRGMTKTVCRPSTVVSSTGPEVVDFGCQRR